MENGSLIKTLILVVVNKYAFLCKLHVHTAWDMKSFLFKI